MLKPYGEHAALWITNLIAWSTELDDRKRATSEIPPLVKLDEMEADFTELEMDVAIAQIETVRRIVRDGGKREVLIRAINELRSRIIAHLGSRYFLLVRPSAQRYYTDSSLFGEAVAAKFPSAISDIDNAGKCLALDQGTACVFHLMRVMEVGLRALGRALGIPYAPSWESYLTQINRQIGRDWREKEPEWKVDEAFYSAVAGDLLVVKTAWRNPTMHVRITYDGPKALEIFNAVRTFMQHLATKVQEESWA
jgi:hypothetical protein